MENNAVDVTKVAIEQCWEQIRHVESERRWILAACTAVVTGGTVYLAQKAPLAPQEPVIVFGALLAVLFWGLLYSVRMLLVLDAFYSRLDDLQKVINSYLESVSTIGNRVEVCPPRNIGFGFLSLKSPRVVATICTPFKYAWQHTLRQRYLVLYLYLFGLILFAVLLAKHI